MRQRSMESWYTRRLNEVLDVQSVAFTAPKLPGRVYFLADISEPLQQACRNMSGIFYRKFSMVSSDDRRLVVASALHGRHDITKLQPGRFMRIRRGLYAGDVADAVHFRSNLPPLGLDKLCQGTRKSSFSHSPSCRAVYSPKRA